MRPKKAAPKPDSPEARPTAYMVVPTGYDDMVHTGKFMWALYVVDGFSEHGWVVRRGSVNSPVALDAAFEWEFEPQPSSRDEEYLRTHHRWPLEEAMRRALIAVDGVVLNGCTASEASFRVRWRLEREAEELDAAKKAAEKPKKKAPR